MIETQRRQVAVSESWLEIELQLLELDGQTCLSKEVRSASSSFDNQLGFQEFLKPLLWYI